MKKTHKFVWGYGDMLTWSWTNTDNLPPLPTIENIKPDLDYLEKWVCEGN